MPVAAGKLEGFHLAAVDFDTHRFYRGSPADLLEQLPAKLPHVRFDFYSVFLNPCSLIPHSYPEPQAPVRQPSDL